MNNAGSGARVFFSLFPYFSVWARLSPVLPDKHTCAPERFEASVPAV
jgi:hypothetical protein